MLYKFFSNIIRWIQRILTRLPEERNRVAQIKNDETGVQIKSEEVEGIDSTDKLIDISHTTIIQSTIHLESESKTPPLQDETPTEKQLGSSENIEYGTTPKPIIEGEREKIEVELGNKEDIQDSDVKRDDKKPQKPYIKKTPTEKSDPATEEKDKKPKTKEIINLGNSQRWNRRQKQTTNDVTEGMIKDDNPKTNKERQQNDKPLAIKSPFIELNLDEATIDLVLPQQYVKNGPSNNSKNRISYLVTIENLEKERSAKLKQRRNGKLFVEEIKIPIEKPIEKFEVSFPEELESRNYTYKNDGRKHLYVFSSKGDKKAKMDYLYNEKGEKNFLPRKILWILLHENFEIELKKELEYERYFWDSYKLCHLNL
ncbi:MAG: hypothetical protein Q7S39_11075, partial [Ignavibacteria bacterium]|nr:hypothetical protein [Ignavibacteria bacterium]